MTAHAQILKVDDPYSSGRDRMASWPFLAGLAITLLITAFRMAGSVDSDVASQLWIAERLHNGARLYTDIVETNPPLWFWMAVPIERFSAALHLRIEAVLIATIGALVVMSLAATSALVRYIPLKQRIFLLGYAALTLAAMPWVHVGQREQLALIATLPYSALVSARRRGDNVSGTLATLVGTGAALAYALKHYFLIVPILLELWLISGQLRRWRPLRPETIGMAAIGAGYAVAIMMFARDYLTRIIPLLKLSYGLFGSASLAQMFGPFCVLGILLLAVILSQARILVRNFAPLASALTIAALGFGAIYFIQFKGWHYHAIPLIGCTSLSLAALLAETPITSLLRLLAPALLTLPLGLSASEQSHPTLPDHDLLEAVSGLGPGDAVGFLTTEPAIPWSITVQRQFRYASRYNALWLMPAIVRNERLGSPNAELTKLGRQIVSDTVDDYTCISPRRIIVSRPRRDDPGFDLLMFFLRDPRFGSLLSHYRVRSRSTLETYELASPLPQATFPCPKGL